ncbi:MAG TPA: hypothetical protein VH251_12465 [Verrucomicrobiae bacterium]|nr:hypothetical protein [Verrucomicrobiae bacterium]
MLLPNDMPVMLLTELTPAQDGSKWLVFLLMEGGAAIIIGLLILGWMLTASRRARLNQNLFPDPFSFLPLKSESPPRPACWLAVRSVSTEAVKTALGLNRAAPCSWVEGLAGSHEFFISPRVHGGWVIVTGLGLPNPSDDVDATFLFLTALSRKLGHVQFFYAEKFSRHHGWARLDDGCVTRGYAWAGETVWNQGAKTLPESEAGLKTFGYGEQTATILDAEINFEKVPQLAARWSLDPAEVKLDSTRQSIGLAGESALG